MSDNVAMLDGFTVEYIASTEGADYHILVEPHADLDDVFRAYDCDRQEYVRVRGWLYQFERLV